jgi:hypothetical protein
MTIDIADLDTIFLSFDEAKKEEFWIHIKNMVPWAKRVDGVKGSDAAHKAAADASETDRFILIDGDNLPDPAFFNLQLTFPTPEYERAVFRWRARNAINGLMYGNGGISCWTKEFVYGMRTHENSDGSAKTKVEFCFDPLYWPMHDCYSVTHPNGSPFQAWRAGFREGVKMCLDQGAKPSIAEFRSRVHRRNMDHLSIWHNVGADTEHGLWAIVGSRQGTLMTMLLDWDYTEVQSFEKLAEIYSTVECDRPVSTGLVELAHTYAEPLQEQLALPMTLLNAEQSRFFKHHYRSNWHNRGPMVREIDVIREQEKW